MVDALAGSVVTFQAVDLDVTRGFFVTERAGGGGGRGQARSREEDGDEEGRECGWSTARWWCERALIAATRRHRGSDGRRRGRRLAERLLMMMS
jgi:hypothetical protein